MKTKLKLTMWTVSLMMLGLLWVNADVFGQETGQDPVRVDILEQMQELRDQLANDPNTAELRAQVDALRAQLADDPANADIRSQLDALRGQIQELHNPALISQMDALREQLQGLRPDGGRGFGGPRGFIDMDGDGINDGFQRGIGVRQGKGFGGMRGGPGAAGGVRGFDGKGKFGHISVDTDGDGVADQIMVDLDGDGEGDTSLQEHLQARWQLMDQDGDGNPDPVTRDEIQQHLQAMREWQQSVMQRIQDGLPAFIDENEDGIPDDRPDHLPMRGRGGMGGGPGGPGGGN
jgi:hypothetical protein